MKQLEEKYKILIMAFLLVISVFLTYYFHKILGTGTVFTHFFYIPVFLGALWWKRKGLLIAVFLASLILFSHLFIRVDPITLNDFFRSLILLFIGIVSCYLFEEIEKLAEQRYKIQNDFFRVVLDSIDAEISIIDVNNFNIVCGNKTFLKNVGKTNEEVLGQPCYKIIQQRSDPCIPPDLICPLPETVKTQKYSAAVHVYHGKNDEKKYVEISTSPIYDERGKIIEVVHIARDITERKQADEALRMAHENTKTIFEKAPIGVVVIGRDRKIRMVNDTALKMAGMENADIILGKNCGEYLCPAQQKDCPILDKGQHIDNSERILRRKDGKEIPIIKTVTEINMDGEDVLLETFVDITERKQAEEALRIAHENTKTIFEKAPIGVVVIGRDRKIRMVNDTALKMAGIENADTVLGKNCGEYLCPAQQNECPILDKGQQVDNSERILRRKDGKEIPIIKTVTEINIDGEDVLLETFVDITELKQVEKALIESEKRLKTLINSAQDGILIADIETKKFVYSNPAFCNMIGYSMEELMGMDMSDIHPKDQLEYIISEFESQARNEKTLAANIPCLKKDGTIFYADINTTCELINGRKCNIGFFRDITEHKQAEEKLKQTNIELKKVDKLKTQFLSVVSHELRTPLTPMKAQLQMFLGGYLGDVSDKQRKSLEMILRNTSRLDRLIGDVLDISKLESGSMKFIMEINNFNTNVESAVETMRPKAEAKNITLSLKQDTIPEIVFDADRIIQLIINLVNNAIKFTDPDGTIEVEVLDNSNYATVKVKDSGIGIEKEDLDRIFIPFEQVDSSYTRKYEGSGLGLAISQGIVSSHGGKIWIESEPGKGSCFQFTIDYNCVSTNEGIETDLFQKESTVEYSG